MTWTTLQHTVISGEAAGAASGEEGAAGLSDQSHTLVLDLGSDYNDATCRVYLNGRRVSKGAGQWCWKRPTASNDVELWWPVQENDTVIIDYDTV